MIFSIKKSDNFSNLITSHVCKYILYVTNMLNLIYKYNLRLRYRKHASISIKFLRSNTTITTFYILDI